MMSAVRDLKVQLHYVSQKSLELALKYSCDSPNIIKPLKVVWHDGNVSSEKYVHPCQKYIILDNQLGLL